MIRKLKRKDIEAVMQIWLHSNIEAHSFISQKYWHSHFELVKKHLSQADVYVYEYKEKVIGFVGVQESYIAGIFVHKCFRGRGIGKALLDEIKSNRAILQLSVYLKNHQAIEFYKREGFLTVSENLEQATDEIEIVMACNK